VPAFLCVLPPFPDGPDGIATDLERPRYPALGGALCQRAQYLLFLLGGDGAALGLGREDLVAGFAAQFLRAAAVGTEADDRLGLLAMRTGNGDHEAILQQQC